MNGQYNTDYNNCYQPNAPQMAYSQNMMNSNQQMNQQHNQAMQQSQETSIYNNSSFYNQFDPKKPMPYIRITEQPASLRFRYQCEGSTSVILGVNSKIEKKTYPSIKIEGYTGKIEVVVSCVTVDPPYMAHPHKLLFKKNKPNKNQKENKDLGNNGNGVCMVQFSSQSMEYSFDNLRIECVKKREVAESLETREQVQVDPFSAGFSHKNNPNSINLSAIRLCFQAFIPFTDSRTGKLKRIKLKPVVSQVIFDAKTQLGLVICNAVPVSGCVQGGDPMIILCEKIVKTDIEVRFYEEKDGEIVWEHIEKLAPNRIHKQCALSFLTPKYKNQEIDRSVKVYFHLYKPSDQSCSDPCIFEMLPNYLSNPLSLKRKREDRIPPKALIEGKKDNIKSSNSNTMQQNSFESDSGETSYLQVDKRKKCLNELISIAANSIPHDSQQLSQPINNSVAFQQAVQNNTQNNAPISDYPPNVTIQTRENVRNPYCNQQNNVNPRKKLSSYMYNQMNSMHQNWYQQNQMGNNQGYFDYSMVPQNQQSLHNQEPLINQQLLMNQQDLINQQQPLIDHPCFIHPNSTQPMTSQFPNSGNNATHGEPQMQYFAEKEDYKNIIDSESISHLSDTLRNSFLEDIDFSNMITGIKPDTNNEYKF